MGDTFNSGYLVDVYLASRYLNQESFNQKHWNFGQVDNVIGDRADGERRPGSESFSREPHDGGDVTPC